MEKKITFNDLRDGLDAIQHYKLTPRQVEVQVRRHLAGATQKELTAEYHKIYTRRK